MTSKTTNAVSPEVGERTDEVPYALGLDEATVAAARRGRAFGPAD